MAGLKTVLLYLISAFPRTPCRTDLVKLVYFAELKSWRLYGRSFASAQFVRYFYGPYSEEVVEAINSLVHDGIVEETIVHYGCLDHGKHVYSITPGLEEVSGLSTEETDILDYVVAEYGKLTTRRIRELSYSTLPMCRILEQEKACGYPLYREELELSCAKPPRRRRSRARLQKAFKRINREKRGSDEEYARVVAEEMRELRPFLKRAMETEE